MDQESKYWKEKKKYDFTDSPGHRRHPSLETKLEILRRCFEDGEDIKSITEEYGYSRESIYNWRKKYLSGGSAAIMNKKKDCCFSYFYIDLKTF